MRLLAFSDLHRDLAQARRLVEQAVDADVVAGVGDFASVHRGLDETIAALREIETPTLLVPGNNETDEALREACRGWEAATVLHGEGAEVRGVPFFGLGGGVPVTPWDWSFDLGEDDAAIPYRILKAARLGRRTITPPLAGVLTWERAVVRAAGPDEWVRALRAEAGRRTAPDRELRAWALEQTAARVNLPLWQRLDALGIETGPARVVA